MSNLDALLEGIVADPANEVRWQVLADWLEEFDDPRRGELTRLHLRLRQTCTQPEQHPERDAWHARMMELMRSGVRPCVPTRTLTLPGDVELRLAFIPPGTFLMGSPESEAERSDDETLHEVTLTKGFFLGVHPVTQAQWQAVMGQNPSEFKGDNLPVEMVSWDDTQQFFKQLKTLAGIALRLPTEAEWEYAARAGTTTPYHFGSSLNGHEANCDGNYPYGREEEGPYREQTTTVGQFVSQSPHPWGLTDVHGNVWEWCEDLFDEQFYGQGAVIDPICTKEQLLYRVLRGGSWRHHAWICRAAFRDWFEPGYRGVGYGFRVVFCLD